MNYPQLIIPFSSYSQSHFDEISAKDPSYNSLLNLLRSALPEEPSSDREDDIENFVRVAAALDVVRSDDIWLLNGRMNCSRLSTQESLSLDEVVSRHDSCFHIGGDPVVKSATMFPDHLSKRYHESDVFLKHARRGFSFIDIDIDGDYRSSEKEIINLLHSFSPERRVHPGILKLTGGKYHVLPVDAIDGSDELVSLDEEDTFVGWAFTGSFHFGTVAMVQQRLNLNCEYRCFTERGSVRAAAGSIEQFTPFDGDRSDFIDGRYSSMVERVRNNGEIYSDPDRVTEMLRFADSVADELYREGKMEDYLCLDVAWDGDNETPVVVEINPVATSGLYLSPVLSTDYLRDFIEHLISVPENALVHPKRGIGILS